MISTYWLIHLLYLILAHFISIPPEKGRKPRFQGQRGCSSDIASYFFRSSKVWSMLHHGSVGAITFYFFFIIKFASFSWFLRLYHFYGLFMAYYYFCFRSNLGLILNQKLIFPQKHGAQFWLPSANFKEKLQKFYPSCHWPGFHERRGETSEE